MKKRKAKKGQIITFDLTTSLLIFLIFIAIFIGIFLISQRTDSELEYEIEYAFANLENNLIFGPSDQAFFRDYRVNKTKLDNFAFSVTNIDDYVLGTVGDSHGIGLDAGAYDACLYFRDNDGTIISLGSGLLAVGELTKPSPPLTCHNEISAIRNPCDNYKQALSLIKPVLLDEGNSNTNRIIQMNLVLCRR